MEKVVLSLSGGMDSTTLLAWLLDRKYEVYPFNFTYGSKHNPYEEEAISNICLHYNLQVPIIDMTETFKHISSNLLMSGGEIPEGHYNDSSMSKTVIPNRNAIFISVLTGIAESIGAAYVALAIVVIITYTLIADLSFTTRCHM
jgi:7-cyano-7-deazaguanine synthase